MIRKQLFVPTMLLGLAVVLWWTSDYMEIAVGVAFFLFGMHCLEEGFKVFTGGTLERVLRRSTDRLWKCLLFGTASTTVMQSSTLVSLITISFVSAEMIALAAGIGIIMGANIGTTTGAWLIAGLGLRVNIAAYAMPILVFGVVMLMQSAKAVKGAGYLLMGAGFLFFGIHYMKEGFDAFQGTMDLSAYSMSGLAGVLMFTLIGMLMTVIMQSSHASLLIIITALAAGQVSYENALAMAIGANLGSAITTALGGLAANIGGRRLAAAHVIFNVISAAVAIAFIGQLSWLVGWLAGVLGIRPDDYLLQLALFHTLFNVLGVVLLLPVVGTLAAGLERWIKPAPQSSEQPLYLYADALETPETAVTAVRKEVQHLFDNASGLIAHGISIKRSVLDSDSSLQETIGATRRHFPLDIEAAYEEKIKSLHSEIVSFIASARSQQSLESVSDELYALRQASRDVVEAVKGMKHLHTNLVQYGLSENVAVRAQYDAIRLQLGKLLRQLRQLMREEVGQLPALEVDAARVELHKTSRKMLDELDELIRSHKLRPAIATSIMNDENYLMQIASNLLDAAQVVLAGHEVDLKDGLSLDRVELKELASKQEATETPR
jgi:phosphate:Na+ symporter